MLVPQASGCSLASSNHWDYLSLSLSATGRARDCGKDFDTWTMTVSSLEGFIGVSLIVAIPSRNGAGMDVREYPKHSTSRLSIFCHSGSSADEILIHAERRAIST